MKTSNPVPTSLPSNSNLKNRQWLTYPKSSDILTLPPIQLVQPVKNLLDISSNQLHFSSQYHISVPTQT